MTKYLEYPKCWIFQKLTEYVKKKIFLKHCNIFNVSINVLNKKDKDFVRTQKLVFLKRHKMMFHSVLILKCALGLIRWWYRQPEKKL